MKNLEVKGLNLIELNEQEILLTDGGSFWYDVAYVAGMIAAGLEEMGAHGKGNPHI